MPAASSPASSGNHAQALALAARLHGIPATILMPQDAPASKRAATEGYGAEVVAFDRYYPTTATRSPPRWRPSAVRRSSTPTTTRSSWRGRAPPPSSSSRTRSARPAPRPGGGRRPHLRRCHRRQGAEPGHPGRGRRAEASDDVARSKRAGSPQRVTVGRTIADGQQLAEPGRLTWPVIDALVDDVVTVTDVEILAAMRCSSSGASSSSSPAAPAPSRLSSPGPSPPARARA